MEFNARGASPQNADNPDSWLDVALFAAATLVSQQAFTEA